MANRPRKRYGTRPMARRLRSRYDAPPPGTPDKTENSTTPMTWGGQPRVPPLAPGVSWWIPGPGYTPWAPGAQFDYSRQAGRLDANSIVASCLRWIRCAMSQATIEIGKLIDGDFDPDPNHAINLFFNSKPNPFYSWRQVWGATSDGYCVDGNAYWIKARDEHGLVQEVYWVPSHWIRVQTDPRGVIYKYIYTPGRLAQTVTAGGIEYDPDDIIHFRDSIDPLNPVMGLSTLKRNIRNIVGVNEGENYTARILANLGVPGVVFVPDSEAGYVDEPTAAMIAERWEQMTGGENRGKPMVMSRPMRMERLGLSPEELALDRVIDRPEAMIHASLGLNSLVTGCPSSDSTRTYSNLAEANKGAWENCVIPIQDALAEHIKDGLGVEFDLDADHVLQWDRSQIEALGEQADARAARAVALFQATLYPRDMTLQQCGFDPVEGEDGELYYGEPTEEQARKASMATAEEEAEPVEESTDEEESSKESEDAGDETEGEGDGDGGSMMAEVDDETSDVPEEKALKKKSLKKPHLAHTARVSKTGKPVAPYEESAHPRGARGKFTDKPGSEKKKPEPTKKPSPTEEPPPQPAGKETGHFQEHKQEAEKRRSATASSEGGAKGPEPAESIKDIVAKGGTVSKAEHVFAKKVEQRISRKLSAKWLSDNEPVDAELKDGGKEHGVEIKSLPKGSKQSITMHADARLRKVEYAAEKPNREVHTVAYDARNEYQGGKYKENYSGHTLYYRRGAGEYALTSMHKVKDFDELSRLIKTPYDQLPDKAKGSLPTGEAVERLRESAARAHESRLRKDRALRERKKTQGEQ